MRYLYLFTFLCFLQMGCKTQFVKKSIFNGKNLQGWKIYGNEKWYVDDGEIVAESGPDEEYGYLATRRTYKDFILELEFLQEMDGNSGVFFRSSLDGVDITGWQAEVAPPGNSTGGIYESNGRGWLVKPTTGGTNSLKMGEWNKLKITAIDNMVKTTLNGRDLLEIHDTKIGEARGKIALQISAGGGSKVRWKNVNIWTKDLDETEQL